MQMFILIFHLGRTWIPNKLNRIEHADFESIVCQQHVTRISWQEDRLVISSIKSETSFG